MNSSVTSNVLIISCDVGRLVNNFPGHLTFVNHVAACFFSVFNMLTTMILNSLTFATFWSSPKMRKSIILVRFTTVMCSGFILFTMFTYTRIGIKVIASARQRRQNLSPSSENDQCQRRKKHANFVKEIKLAKSCFMIVICYVLCSTPVIVFIGILGKSLSDRNLIIANVWCVNLYLLNSSLDSVIFFWRSRELRKQTICLLQKMNIFNKTR